jgi:hypothetical protein
LYCLQYYQDTLDATITQLKSEGKYDSGIVTIKVGGRVAGCLGWLGDAVRREGAGVGGWQTGRIQAGAEKCGWV